MSARCSSCGTVRPPSGLKPGRDLHLRVIHDVFQCRDRDACWEMVLTVAYGAGDALRRERALVHEAAVALFGDGEARRWLSTPHPDLDLATPDELAERYEARRVLALLASITERRVA